MCRLIGVVARHPAPVAELLGEDLEPFLELACEHKDGWGIGFRTETGLIGTVKATDRADDSTRLRQELRSWETDMAILHIRMASPRLAVSVGNTHPFGDEWAAFAHNGEIRPADVLDPLISPGLLKQAEGETDSERYYLAVREQIDQGATAAAAIASTAAAIRERAEAAISLNCLMLTPEGIFSYAEHDPDSEVIGRRGAGFFGLSYRREPDRTIVASQGWPQPAPRWQTLPEGRVAWFGRPDQGPEIY
ncbi:class II glutamine amidotransferase [Kineosporia babensis]|uniref:Class II glutamine amidotransferase n=1 Tax=Kineosporia babensis TaxID=499548 RepID=A0A9X1NAT2_9ACTN|nr:class II glutamine amidotransferase [Kineosporia babensis]MCD5310290.1 class II glutamine amidotransferase [Kineosporia babensis]